MVFYKLEWFVTLFLIYYFIIVYVLWLAQVKPYSLAVCLSSGWLVKCRHQFSSTFPSLWSCSLIWMELFGLEIPNGLYFSGLQDKKIWYVFCPPKHPWCLQYLEYCMLPHTCSCALPLEKFILIGSSQGHAAPMSSSAPPKGVLGLLMSFF